MPDNIRFVLIGDIVGRSGREKLEHSFRKIKAEYSPDIIIVNVENAAGGFGLTKKIYDHLLDIGIDVMTSGNHIFDNKDIIKNINNAKRLIRPYNYPRITPGFGELKINLSQNREVLIANIQGRIFMPCIDCPFNKMEELLEKYNGIKNIIVDFHGEATAEKQAFAHYFDGRVSAIIGTHTHVATTDCSVLPGGTGYITDVGMCGVKDSVIGMEKKPSIDRFLTMTKVRFGPATGKSILQGVFAEINERGKCSSIKHFEF